MDLGIGLPNTLPGSSGETLVQWSRRAELRGFSTLGTIDRLVYPSFEPLIALSAAAAVTKTIGLCTSVLLVPLRESAAVLAKQALSLQALSAGRLTLGVGVGGRENDFAVAELDLHARGKEMDRMLDRLTAIWDADELRTATGLNRPQLLIGGSVEASFRRSARHHSAGWIAGGLPPDQFAAAAEKVREGWLYEGREDSPKLKAVAYFALGERSGDDASGYLTDYYGWLGSDAAEAIAASAATDAETVRNYIAGFEAVGCDELLMLPCNGDLEEVERLADATGTADAA